MSHVVAGYAGKYAQCKINLKERESEKTVNSREF